MAIPILSITQLTDNDLLARVQRAAQDERVATTQLIALLMELDTRRLYLGEGFSSLFTYCTQAVHLSEHAAYGRIEAARAARRFPLILEFLNKGDLNLTAVTLLAPHLTPENHIDVLAAARHKTKREVEHLVASIRPEPNVPSAIRKLPEPKAALSPRGEASTSEQQSVMPSGTCGSVPHKSLPEVKPLAPERYKIQFTVSRDTYEQLRRAQDLLRHSIPNGDPGAIFERALSLLVTELSKGKLAATSRPRPARAAAATSRHVPAAVKRTVWQRDGGRCAFEGVNGRCTETGFLEYHHVVPFASGGETTVENIELRCRAHNAYEADRYFGTSYRATTASP